jgi:hypothetical protein
MLNPLSNYLILVAGNNGGTGKSTLTRGIVDVLASNKIDYKAFDGDACNLTLSRFYPNISKLDFSKECGADQLILDMEKNAARILIVDVPTGSGAILKDRNKELDIFSEAANLGYELRIVSTISRSRSSLDSCECLMNLTDDPSLHIVFKNLFWGRKDEFTLFDKSAQKQKLLETGGLILEMKEIPANDFIIMDENTLTFSLAAESENYLHIVQRSRIKAWLKSLENTILTNAKEHEKEAVSA